MKDNYEEALEALNERYDKPTPDDIIKAEIQALREEKNRQDIAHYHLSNLESLSELEFIINNTDNESLRIVATEIKRNKEIENRIQKVRFDSMHEEYRKLNEKYFLIPKFNSKEEFLNHIKEIINFIEDENKPTTEEEIIQRADQEIEEIRNSDSENKEDEIMKIIGKTSFQKEILRKFKL